MHEYYFNVNVDDDKGVPFGPVNKDNMDISRLIVDFSCWLDPAEGVTELSHMAIKANPVMPLPPWQADYPLDETSAIVLPEDLYPLLFVDHALANNGKAVTLDLAAGTPQLSYAVSFTATAGVSRRRRLVDILMVIDKPLNPDMVDVGNDVFPVFTYPLVITDTTALPAGFAGRVYIENAVNAPIIVTLPPSPQLGDVISFLDVFYTNFTYPVTFVGHSTAPAIANPDGTVTGWVSNISGDDLTFEWTGNYWVVGTKLFPFSAPGVSG